MMTHKPPIMARKIKIERPKPRAPGIEGAFRSEGHTFGIVVSRFNSFITERLLASALDALRRTGAPS